MCLITTQKEPKIAKRAMKVYKYMRTNPWEGKGIYSLYKSHEWILGKLYEVKIEESDEWCCADSIDSDWLTVKYPGWNYNSTKRINLKCIAAGFHAVHKKERLTQGKKDQYPREDIYECTVPKGAEYYKDATGLIVSSKIIINRKMKKSEY